MSRRSAKQRFVGLQPEVDLDDTSSQVPGMNASPSSGSSASSTGSDAPAPQGKTASPHKGKAASSKGKAASSKGKAASSKGKAASDNNVPSTPASDIPTPYDVDIDKTWLPIAHPVSNHLLCIVPNTGLRSFLHSDEDPPADFQANLDIGGQDFNDVTDKAIPNNHRALMGHHMHIMKHVAFAKDEYRRLRFNAERQAAAYEASYQFILNVICQNVDALSLAELQNEVSGKSTDALNQLAQLLIEMKKEVQQRTVRALTPEHAQSIQGELQSLNETARTLVKQSSGGDQDIIKSTQALTESIQSSVTTSEATVRALNDNLADIQLKIEPLTSQPLFNATVQKMLDARVNEQPSKTIKQAVDALVDAKLATVRSDDAYREFLASTAPPPVSTTADTKMLCSTSYLQGVADQRDAFHSAYTQHFGDIDMEHVAWGYMVEGWHKAHVNIGRRAHRKALGKPELWPHLDKESETMGRAVAEHAHRMKTIRGDGDYAATFADPATRLFLGHPNWEVNRSMTRGRALVEDYDTYWGHLHTQMRVCKNGGGSPLDVSLKPPIVSDEHWSPEALARYTSAEQGTFVGCTPSTAHADSRTEPVPEPSDD